MIDLASLFGARRDAEMRNSCYKQSNKQGLDFIELFQAADGGSSTSESSLGSSSGYGSQSTVRPEDQHNSHQPTLTAVHDGKKNTSYISYFLILLFHL